jgi:methyl-CpG-binding domain protein 4
MFEPLRDDLMVQQQIDGSWQHMVGVIFLNQTGRIQVKRCLPEFLYRWPTPKKYLKSKPEKVIEVIRSLGFYNRRENTLRRMSEDFLTWNGEDANDLYGIGKYGSDSYRIFFQNDIPSDVGDHELRRYLREELKDPRYADEVSD